MVFAWPFLNQLSTKPDRLYVQLAGIQEGSSEPQASRWEYSQPPQREMVQRTALGAASAPAQGMKGLGGWERSGDALESVESYPH